MPAKLSDVEGPEKFSVSETWKQEKDFEYKSVLPYLLLQSVKLTVQMITIETIKQRYPLHWLAWNNNYEELEAVLSRDEHDKEQVDCRGRTPLMLAVTLGHYESVLVLVRHSVNVDIESTDGWTAVQEAISTGNPELVQLLLDRRDMQRLTTKIGGIPQLLAKLREAPDFYVEMKWEFSSWVSLVSRMCPSDTYKVYKQGSNVRIDTTLLGFDQSNWQRGNRSYIFIGENDMATVMEIDHEMKHVVVEHMKIAGPREPISSKNNNAAIGRLTSPIVTTYVDTEKINFERNKCGIWGWRSDKSETINGHTCKVFSATNVQLITKTRTEHLTDPIQEKPDSSKVTSLTYGVKPEAEQELVPDETDVDFNPLNPHNITPEEYFDAEYNLNGRDIGRPKEVTTKVQKFKANLWLCEDYPLRLQDQIIPIVDLMALSSSHFAKLKDFIQMQLPSGFPVKIEIPLFHIINARITFGNIFGLDQEVPGVTTILDENGKMSCAVDDACFTVPPNYLQLVPDIRRPYTAEEEDNLIQFAIQQSLLDVTTDRSDADIWETIKAQKPARPPSPADEECQLQRAIQASLALNPTGSTEGTSPEGNTDRSSIDDDLNKAILLSQLHQEEEERRRKEEEDLLKQVLELSLKEQ